MTSHLLRQSCNISLLCCGVKRNNGTLCLVNSHMSSLAFFVISDGVGQNEFFFFIHMNQLFDLHCEAHPIGCVCALSCLKHNTWIPNGFKQPYHLQRYLSYLVIIKILHSERFKKSAIVQCVVLFSLHRLKVTLDFLRLERLQIQSPCLSMGPVLWS